MCALLILLPGSPVFEQSETRLSQKVRLTGVPRAIWVPELKYPCFD